MPKGNVTPKARLKQRAAVLNKEITSLRGSLMSDRLTNEEAGGAMKRRINNYTAEIKDYLAGPIDPELKKRYNSMLQRLDKMDTGLSKNKQRQVDQDLRP